MREIPDHQDPLALWEILVFREELVNEVSSAQPELLAHQVRWANYSFPLKSASWGFEKNVHGRLHCVLITTSSKTAEVSDRSVPKTENFIKSMQSSISTSEVFDMFFL